MTVTPEGITGQIQASSSTRVGIDIHSITLSDGTFLVAYVASDGDATTGLDVVAQQFDAIGNKIGAEMVLASTTSTDASLQFDIVALENNQIGFGFENFGDIQVEVFDIANGVATQNAVLSQTINTPGSALLDVALSGDSIDTLTLNYTERTAGTNVVMEERDVSGGEFTASSVVSSTLGGDASIELDSDTLDNGNTVVVVDRVADAESIVRSFFIAATEPDGTVVFAGNIIDLDTANLFEPRVTALKDGGFVVGYARTLNGDNEVLYQIFENDGSVRAGPFRVLNNGVDEDDDPELIALDDGGFLYLLDSDTGSGGILGQRFDSDGVGVGQTFTVRAGDGPSVIAATTLEDGRLAVSTIEGPNVFTQVFTTEVPDLIEGSDGGDLFNGTSGDDTLNGLDGADDIDAGDGNDIIDGGEGDDILFGGLGNDLFIGGAGADEMDGGGNFNTVSYDNSTSGLVVDFDDATASTGDAEGDIFIDIDAVIASAFDDTINADEGIDVDAGAGDDLIFGDRNSTLSGGDGDDTVSYQNDDDGADIQLEGANGFHSDDDLREIENVIGSNFGDGIGGNNAANILSGEGGNDFVLAFGGDDLVSGGEGDDTLEGGEGEDTLTGDDGNDDIFGDQGDDVITGGIGIDNIRGGSGADDLNGGADSDFLDGDDDDDILTGEGGADTLRGGNGDDTISGGDDDDEIDGDAGNDGIDGGDGNDALSGDAGNDDINGGAGDDDIFGGAGKDTINAGADGDTVNAGTGNDIINGEDGDDKLSGSEGQDTISGGEGFDAIFAGSGDDEVTGDAGIDFIFGDGGADVLDGGADNDALEGGIGDDLLIGGIGADSLVGGDGIDTADYVGSAVGVEVDLFVEGASFGFSLNDFSVSFLKAGTGIGGEAQGDFLAEVENVIGSAFDDELTGDDNANVLTGGTGEDELDGDAGNDTLLGGEGDDEITGGAGNDELDGGADIDTAVFTGLQDGFTFASLSATSISVTAQNGEVDTLANIEFLQFDDGIVAIDDVIGGNPGGGDQPTSGNDSLTGTEGADNINGIGGDDNINGLGGDDLLSGGAGNDGVSGGTGDDRLFGNGGDDDISGGLGNDTIFGGAGNDDVEAGNDDDEVSGQGGADTIDGGDGTDILRGGSGNDDLRGGSGNDQLFGNGNNDTLDGGAGNDVLQGAAGADVLLGGSGNDQLSGGTAGDRLDGGTGNDVLNGGVNDGVRDTFVFLVGYDEDRINAFDQAGTDRIELDEDLWLATEGVLSAQEVVDTFGSLNGTGSILTLDFGAGDILEVQNSGAIDAATLGLDVVIV